MKKALLIFGLLVVALLEVNGYAQAPGTYPENEMSDSSDMEVPKNPYQSGWTGYEYYYEKEPKKSTGSGQMPAFQSIESLSTDRESPEDPVGYQASGSESGPKKTTPTPTPATTTTEATTTEVPAAQFEVSPSSTTGTSPPSTTTTTTTTATTTTRIPVVSTTVALPVTSNAISPDTGTDLSAAGELYGGGEEKEVYSAPAPSPLPPALPSPKNLLTTIIEKKKSMDTPDSYEDHLGGPSGYEMAPESTKEIVKQPEPASKGSGPGSQPEVPRATVPQSTLDYGQNSEHNNQKASNYKDASEPKDSTNQHSNIKITVEPTVTSAPVSIPSIPDYGQNHQDNQKSSSMEETTTQKTISSSSKSETPNYGQYQDHLTGSAPGSEPSRGNTKPTSSTSSSYVGPEKTQTDVYQETVPYPSNEPYRSGSGGSDYGQNQGTSPETDKNERMLGNEPHVASENDSSEDISMVPTRAENWSELPPTSTKYTQDGYDAPKIRTSSPESYPSIPYSTDRSAPGAFPEPKPNSRGGTVSSKFGPGTETDYISYPSSNSNNAISPRDPYDHFGTAPAPKHHRPRVNHPNPKNHHSAFEDEFDGGYGDGEDDGMTNGNAPDRSAHTPTLTGNDVRAQISEIDRIAESFENSAREPVEYEHKITSESSKGITVEVGKDIKHLGRKARKCCSCCDEKQPVTRNIETKVEPAVTQHLGNSPSQPIAQEPVQQFVPLENTVGGSAYVQQPVQQPPQSHYQQPFQQYQPQYPQSYPYQQPSGCGCQPQPQNCCAPPQPCCMPTIPCCPPIPCCPQPKICCQPQPVCAPPPTCCSINFRLPTIPICGRACPSCPCRRRVHKSRRLKRHALSTNCNQCSAAGEPWKTVHHHREKRAAGCAAGFSTVQQSSCSTCGASHLRSSRVKRMGCLPCLGRKKRDTEENSHIRVKRMGCLPCLGRKKRSALSPGSGCSQCNSLGHLFNRYKRSLFGCSPCAAPQPCGCQGRKKRSVSLKVFKRAPVKRDQCDATCCDYTRCPHRQKKETLVPFM